MSKRNRREHGRIISVETKTRGDALADDFAAGVTSITVEDAGDFDEDGGWLLIGGQVVEFTECDDDTGVITLADPLTAAAEQGDPVRVWSELYEEVVDYQQALVELDGEYDNPDPVAAEVAEGVADLPEGDRGKAGESCTLKRVADDEWEVVGVGGRPRQSQDTRWEQDDFYVLTAADIAAGTAIAPLTHQPDAESVDARWRTTPQEPTEYTVNDDQTVTWPLSGFEAAGDRLWFHYTYRKGIVTAAVTDDPPYDPTACSVLAPTTVVASMEVFNSTNWKAHATINGTWKDLGVPQATYYLVYRDATDPTGPADPYRLSPPQTMTQAQMDSEIINGWYGGNRVGSHLYGLILVGNTSGLDASKTPQEAANGVLGTTDPSKCRFWWGEQIAVTSDRSNEPMGDINGNLADWWSLL